MQCHWQAHTLLTDVKVADGFFSRLRGLLGKPGLAREEGLLIIPCNSIHTFGMAFSIGALFLGPEHTPAHQSPRRQVLRVIHRLPPTRGVWPVRGSRAVLEVHPDTLTTYPVTAGDWLSFEGEVHA